MLAVGAPARNLCKVTNLRATFVAKNEAGLAWSGYRRHTMHTTLVIT